MDLRFEILNLRLHRASGYLIYGLWFMVYCWRFEFRTFRFGFGI